jgi:type IV secretory pathway VirB2 component (pilin)
MTLPAYSGSLLDPPGSDPLVSAVQWLQGTLLGTVATTVAIICVAAVGFMMLSGRMNVRYGASVIFGCFILFGASSIVAGVQATAAATGWQSGDYEPPSPVVAAQSPLPVVAIPAAPARPSNSDPYAGAAVPPPR